MKINNQNIYGGNQQYADLIINNSDRLSENDRKLIQLFHENTGTEEERTELVKSLENLRSDDIDEKAKENSRGILKKFFESGAVEAGKQISKEIIQAGLENLL